MATLNFDPSPSNGQTYTENGVTYQWDGNKWTANVVPSTEFDDRYVEVAGDTMTGGLVAPALTSSGSINGAAGAFTGSVSANSADIGSSNISLNADGSAQFAVGKFEITAGGIPNIRVTGTATNTAFRLYQTDQDATNPSFTLRNSGTLRLGNIDTGAVGAITLNNDGRALFTGEANNGKCGVALNTINSDTTQSKRHGAIEQYAQGSTGNQAINIIYSDDGGARTQQWRVNSAGNATLRGTLTQNASDSKFKENIVDGLSQLEDIKALSFRQWGWIANTPGAADKLLRRTSGLIAQEAELVDSKLVYTVEEEDGDSYKAIDHDVLLMKVFGALKESIMLIEALETRLAALEG